MKNQIKRGDIYYADLTGCFGSEQGGYRPVLVIQNNIGNKYSPTTIVATLTSIFTKKQLPTHVYINAENYGTKKDSIVLLEQIRTIDKGRLKEYVSSLDEEKMREIDNSMAISLGMAS